MKIAITIFISLFTTTLLTQTKPVAFRSHSGNMKYFSMAEPDNLGWSGNQFQLNNIDSSYFINVATSIPDTATNYPYCNNPAIPKDSLEKNYPFYTGVIKNDSTKINSIDTLAKPQERIKSRNEMKENGSLPIGDANGGNDLNPPTPSNYFLVSFLVIMALIGTMIWITNRKKIMISQ